MTPLDRETLTAIAGHSDWPSITFYLPTHRTFPEKEQDRIRLKNLLREACDTLVATGMRPPDADALCEPVRSLLEDDSFWREGADGLALFVSRTATHLLRSETPVPEQVLVGERFYLRPLLAARRSEREFFALAIDRNGCRLFKGDGTTIEEVVLEGVPTSLADELRYDETQEAVQYSSVPSPASAAGGGRASGAIFHGHGGEKDTDKSNLERYLRKIETAVTAKVREVPGAPLALLGVEYSLAMYRSLNSSPSLADAQVTGATDELPPHEVHERVLAALEPHFEAETASRLASLADAEGSGLALHDPTKIVGAAAEGRVRMLFFDDSVGPFGTFDRESHEVDAVCADAPRLLRESSDPVSGAAAAECGWDLVDLAAAETLLHGGEVFAFSGEDAPVKGAAALLRY